MVPMNLGPNLTPESRTHLPEERLGSIDGSDRTYSVQMVIWTTNPQTDVWMKPDVNAATQRLERGESSPGWVRLSGSQSRRRL